MPIPARLLGHVYEQFLGKVICFPSNRRAVVEEASATRQSA
jgi:hypothetical protein